MWKGNQLTFFRRVILSKSVIEALPIYLMMITMIPKACINEIHKLQRRFIGGETENKRKYHTVKWITITRPKEEGGLGL